MKLLMIFLLVFWGSNHDSEIHKSIDFKDVTIVIPAEWSVKEKEDCLFVWKGKVQPVSYLRMCRVISSGESDYFTMNDDKIWEAITNGIPVLTDVSVTTEYTGMSAIVLCKYKDNAGYHTDKCFQAEIELPTNIKFIFVGRGDSSFFKSYKKIYLSFKIK